MDVYEDLGTAHGHPWFGRHRLRPAAPAETIRQLLRHELRDTGWPYQPLLPAAPMAVPRASYAEVFRAGAALVELLRRTALETGATTSARLAAYGMPATENRLWVRDPFVEERYADCVVRPDLVIGPDGPRFLEFNVSGALGGVVETHCRLAVWRRLHADEHGRTPFRSPGPFAVRAEMFRSLGAELAVAPRVAVVGSARVTGVERRYFEMEADYCDAHGLTARFFEPEELHEAWDCAPRLRYPVGLRNFTIPDWLEAGLDTAPVQEALDNGCLLVGTQTSTFLHSKLTMGLLSEGRPWMTGAERGLVDRYLPWTRILSERKTDRGGRPVDLLPFVLRNRHLLVLKAGLGESGRQVVIGREVGQAGWESAVGDAVGGGTSVVQDFVEPQTCRVALIADGSDEPHDAEVAPVLGPLLFGGRPAGMFCRFYGDGSAGIVSVRAGTSSSDNVMVAI
ncbi:hypothetical protein SSP531S_06610 [Streptomyces spongiicola]|uniref:Circularly permuted type 2 ATP-grasp protein n=1 Tax=Streptomyces spongiicola TaxID=1690221 RepID=A0A2S1YYW2_9ACTN|nr:hypothetical protein [Streptomyces spongiicola]AWK09256.1 hypothetical protein DDQ41_10345 [Streptomyces spongiicola]GBP99266.1 hypothetical protein SSP531S_06610 [Streptomyces spongiicola]